VNIVEHTIKVFEACGYTDKQAMEMIKSIERKHGFTDEDAFKIYSKTYFKEKNQKVLRKLKEKPTVSQKKFNEAKRALQKVMDKGISMYQLFKVNEEHRDSAAAVRQALIKGKMSPYIYDKIMSYTSNKKLIQSKLKELKAKQTVKVDVDKFNKKVKEYMKKHKFETKQQLSVYLTGRTHAISSIITDTKAGRTIGIKRLKELKKVIPNINEIIKKEEK